MRAANQFAGVLACRPVQVLVLPVVQKHVIPHTAAYVTTLYARHGVYGTVDVQERTVVAVQVGAYLRMYARGAAALLAGLQVLALHHVHVCAGSSQVALKTLDGGRIGIAAQALGIAQGAMDETVKYTKERKQFGKAIAHFQNTQFQMANLETRVQAARLLVRSAAYKKDMKLPYSADAAMAKLFAAETAMEVTTKAVQFHGGYGYTREYSVERMMRDAKITEIYEGTSEVQRMVIAAKLFK